MVGAGRVSQASRRPESAVDVESLRTLVVMELGATWPSWLGDSIADCGGSAVQAQASGEPASGFATRVVQRIGNMSGNEKVQLAVLAWSSEVNAVALSSRFRIARAVVLAMRGVPDAELVIAASAGAADGNRHELLGLVAALCDDLSNARVAVRVSFSTSPTKSRTVVRGSAEPWAWSGAAAG